MTTKWADISAPKAARPRWIARILNAVLLVLLCTLHSARAHAGQRIVLLSDRDTPGVAQDETEAELWLATRAQLAEVGVEIVFVRGTSGSLSNRVQRAREVASSATTLAVVWLERRTDSVIVFFYTPRGPHLYSRRLAASGAPAAAEEEIAIVLRSAVSAVLEGGDVDMAEVALPEPAPSPKAAAPPRPAPVVETRRETGLLRVGLGYVGTLYALDTDWQNGATLSLSIQPRGVRWFAGAAYTYFPPLTVAELGTETEIRRHPGELFGGFELELEPLWFIAEGAFIGDSVERSTPNVSDMLLANPDSQRWLWAVSTRLGCAVPVGARARLFFTVGAEFLLNRFDHVVSSGAAGSEPVVSPMLARPRVELGALIGLW